MNKLPEKIKELLRDVIVHGHDLSHRDFRGQEALDGMTFVKCDLSGSNFKGEQLIGTVFVECDLEGTKFSGLSPSTTFITKG